jgi:hypothetical protein
MIELFALIFLTRKIGDLAGQKGQRPGRWKLYMVLCWFGFEFAGAVVGMIISQNIFLAFLLGLACAAGGYLLMKYKLDQMPDIQPDWLDQIGKPDR